eukprot:scaffold1482_cov81-Skeletonema_marinoi.AAC.2
MVLLALQTLHTISYIDKGEASIILLALQPLHSPPISTKAKHPSSQTEKMCLRQEVESYKALLVVAVSFKLI